MKLNTLAVVIATALFTAASSAYAIIDKGYTAIYYSDATLTEEVGMGGVSCANTRFMDWGVRTRYFTIIYEEECCGYHCQPFEPLPH